MQHQVVWRNSESPVSLRTFVPTPCVRLFRHSKSTVSAWGISALGKYFNILKSALMAYICRLRNVEKSLHRANNIGKLLFKSDRQRESHWGTGGEAGGELEESWRRTCKGPFTVCRGVEGLPWGDHSSEIRAECGLQMTAKWMPTQVERNVKQTSVQGATLLTLYGRIMTVCRWNARNALSVCILALCNSLVPILVGPMFIRPLKAPAEECQRL